jgi:hypothetical protein
MRGEMKRDAVLGRAWIERSAKYVQGMAEPGWLFIVQGIVDHEVVPLNERN